MTTFGAVPVGGRNFFRLMQNGEAALLFPGGVREVCVLLQIVLESSNRVPALSMLRHKNSWCSCCQGFWPGCEMLAELSVTST